MSLHTVFNPVYASIPNLKTIDISDYTGTVLVIVPELLDRRPTVLELEKNLNSLAVINKVSLTRFTITTKTAVFIIVTKYVSPDFLKSYRFTKVICVEDNGGMDGI